jgi:phage terminase large subunit-like protein
VSFLNTPDPQWAPTFYTEADKNYDYSDGEKAIEIANLAFGSLPTPFQMDSWQEWLVKEVLSRDPDTNKYRFRSYVVSMGRQ